MKTTIKYGTIRRGEVFIPTVYGKECSAGFKRRPNALNFARQVALGCSITIRNNRNQCNILEGV